MNIDDFKKELQNVRAPKMNKTIASGGMVSAAEFFESLRRQERKDENFVLNRRILPLLLGLVVFSAVAILAPMRTPTLFAGSLLLILSLLAALALYVKDYRDVSRETYDTSVAQFLREKEKRLSRRRSTPLPHYLVFAVFLTGWILINVGNEPFVRSFGRFPFGIFIGAALAVIILLNINSERLYRKRHREEHGPLLKMIAEIRQALEEDK